MSATARFAEMAVRQRDLILKALDKDQACPKTKDRICQWELEGGFFPAGRTTRLLSLWMPRYGYGPFQRQFQAAVSEVAAANLGAFFLPKLERVKIAHEAILDVARSIYEQDGGELPLEEHCRALTDLIGVLPAIQTTKPQGEPAKRGIMPSARRKATSGPRPQNDDLFDYEAQALKKNPSLSDKEILEGFKKHRPSHSIFQASDPRAALRAARARRKKRQRLDDGS
jgi:hypothetical protein